MTKVPAYAERRSWNHVWLVDPLDGREAYVKGSGEFSVNIALVEDGKPIYGVVHAPALALTYFGRLGQGAFKRTASGDARRLSARPEDTSASREEAAGEANHGDRSRALSMCKILERSANAQSVFAPSLEWKVAAAHAVLQLAATPPVDCDSGKEPIYNSESLMVGTLRAGAEQPA
jgi:3'(2'), 5'-bisphosphate nucleotidase